MGSFLGHLFPGVAFSFCAVWWMLAITAQQAVNPRAYRNRANHVWPGGRFSPEAWFKLILCPIGMIGEIITGFRDGQFVNIGNLQHITMYAFFFISGVMDLMTTRKNVNRASNIIPSGSAFAALIIAALVEWLLFRFHLHGRTPLDVLVHTLLGHSILAAILILIAECVFRETVLLGYLRAIAVLTQGLWFISVGYILHNPFGPLPFKDPNDHMSHMIATCLFAWHILLSMAICAIIVFISHRRHGTGSIVNEYARCPDQEQEALKPFEPENP